ncbi:MAG: hypothetical protein DMG08_16310 [Acidobacteria bacterium]|nr:MAG: hypothetical protein DMG08_16310 [Acidobacteriota bacterium]
MMACGRGSQFLHEEDVESSGETLPHPDIVAAGMAAKMVGVADNDLAAEVCRWVFEVVPRIGDTIR